MYFDCHSNPATEESFVLWDDIRVVFADALYVRHEEKMVPFMKDANWVTLKPLRIAAIPDVVLDVIVESSLMHRGDAMQQSTLADTPKEATVHDTPQETPQETPQDTTSPVYNAPRRNPEYGLVETAMDNYSHIDHPDFRPKPRAPQFVPTAEPEEGYNEATPNGPNINSEPVYDNAQSTNNKSAGNSQNYQSPLEHTPTAAVRDISPIVVKASLGDAKSQVELGDMYRVGDGVEQDFDEARYWYLKAANQGDPAGQCNLGHLYRLELGVDRDHWTALSWYKKAAHQGDAGGQCYVGLVYKHGLVGVLDYSAAMDWYMMAANQGYAYAQYSIGNLYDTGRGVQQDYVKAKEWYFRAADQHLPSAQVEIGYMYLKGRGVSQDETIALDWLSKAVRPKIFDSGSQMAMGLIYSYGLGVSKNDSTAFAWFLKAASQGSPSAQSIVSRMYRDGEGIPQDFSKALVWSLKAADHNSTDAQYAIGSMYLQGQGVPKDYSEAKEWYTKAANLGHMGARGKLSEVQTLIYEASKSKSSKLKFW
ncbi:hypothetical protein BGZ89_009699 [Linnemannia elongata]|nr:hypothetical protein BGZ89_009699 [Linnemannia elongata]